MVLFGGGAASAAPVMPAEPVAVHTHGIDAIGVILEGVLSRLDFARALGPPASPPRRGEPDNSGSGGIACLIAVRTVDPAPLGTPERWMLAAVASAVIMLDGADSARR
jgi:hypothetical protein